MEFKIKQLSAPIMAHLEVTNQCNHKCIHCYRLGSDVINRPIENADDELILSNARKLIDGGILQIIITGGEPLMKMRLVKKIILLAKEHNVVVSLNTNLTLLNDDMVGFLKETQTRILVSCPSSIQYSYETITQTKNLQCFENNLSKVVKAGIKTAVNMVVMKDNLSEIRNTAKRMQQLGCVAFCVTPVALNMEYPKRDLLLSRKDIEHIVYDILWIESELKIKVDILDGLPKCIFPPEILSKEHLFLYRRCQAGRSFVAVSPNGDVRPCANANVSYGNLCANSLAEIWGNMSFWRSDKIIPKECEGCAWINRCLGGCRTNAKALNNKWDGTDIWSPKPILTVPPNHAKRIDIQSDTILKVADGIQVRKEYENIYLISCTQNRTFCMVNQSVMDFVMLVKRLESISFDQILKDYLNNIEVQTVKEIITKLIQYKIFKI